MIYSLKYQKKFTEEGRGEEGGERKRVRLCSILATYTKMTKDIVVFLLIGKKILKGNKSKLLDDSLD